MKKVVFLLVILAVILSSTSCFAVAPAEVKTLPPEKIGDIDAMLKKYEDRAVSGWIVGIVYEISYRESYGLRSDPYNLVSAYVYIPKGTIGLMPASGYQEEAFVQRYKPGDIVQFRIQDGVGAWTTSFPFGKNNLFDVELENMVVIGKVD
jgi:hypothetical protein